MTASSTDRIRIRTLRPDEVPLALDWAAAEGWNPGLADAACFATVDKQGFLVGELEGEPAATISCVNYNDSFAFLGFYIVRADLRGHGHGLRIWQEAIAHAGTRVIGLDGVVAQQANYRKSGFTLAYANVRYGGIVAATNAPKAGVFALDDISFAMVESSDATVFPAPRTNFLRAWIASPRHIGRAFLRDGELAGWGVVRPCRRGWKIGPLVCDGRAAAEAVLSALLAAMGGGEIFLDVPSVNSEAVALAQGLGLAPVFETARMYTGAIPRLRIERVFGVTTFELGWAWSHQTSRATPDQPPHAPFAIPTSARGIDLTRAAPCATRGAEGHAYAPTGSSAALSAARAAANAARLRPALAWRPAETPGRRASVAPRKSRVAFELVSRRLLDHRVAGVLPCLGGTALRHLRLRRPSDGHQQSRCGGN
jgi:hypothetical protein